MACTACHGPNGKGIEAAGFPNLSGQKVDYTITTLKEFREGKRANDMNGMMRDIAKALAAGANSVMMGGMFAAHDPTTWPQQAAMAADGRWDELAAWQAELQGGRE